MRPFQIILIGIFSSLAVVGLFVFASFRGFTGSDSALSAGVEIWGTLPRAAFEAEISKLSDDDDAWSKVTYVAKDARTFREDLVESIAEGRAPDLVVLPHDLLVSEYAKLMPIPYDTYSLRTFKDTYVDGAEIFLFPNGIYGLPFAIDPLVMYWNKSMFATNGLAYPPKTWYELAFDTVPKVTVRNDASDILKSTVAFGEYENIVHAKEILSLLIMQAGGDIVTVDDRGFNSDFNLSSLSPPMPPGEAAVRFYTDFANRATLAYSWNKSLPVDRQMFLSEDLALYFGFASELSSIAEGNANLTFDVAEVPQDKNATIRKSYGKVYAFSIPNGARNPAGAFLAAQTLASADHAGAIALTAGLAPVHRALIAAGTSDPYLTVLYRASLTARGWLDPDPRRSDAIMSQLIDDVTSGRVKVNEAISDASSRLQNAF